MVDYPSLGLEDTCTAETHLGALRFSHSFGRGRREMLLTVPVLILWMQVSRELEIASLESNTVECYL